MGEIQNTARLSNRELPLMEQLSYSLRRQLVDEYQDQEFARFSKGAQLLDIGGVKANTRGHFAAESYPLKRITVNLLRSQQVDVVADAASVPMKSQSCDVVVLAEVLEHVVTPPAVLQQVARALRSGGTLLITVPFLFRQHPDPSDYGRYTEWYWQEQLATLGFTSIEITKQGAFYCVATDMLRDWSRQYLLAHQGVRYRLGSWILPRLVRWARRKALLLDGNGQKNPYWRNYTTGFGIRAVKK